MFSVFGWSLLHSFLFPHRGLQIWWKSVWLIDCWSLISSINQCYWLLTCKKDTVSVGVLSLINSLPVSPFLTAVDTPCSSWQSLGSDGWLGGGGGPTGITVSICWSVLWSISPSVQALSRRFILKPLSQLGKYCFIMFKVRVTAEVQNFIKCLFG